MFRFFRQKAHVRKQLAAAAERAQQQAAQDAHIAILKALDVKEHIVNDLAIAQEQYISGAIEAEEFERALNARLPDWDPTTLLMKMPAPGTTLTMLVNERLIEEFRAWENEGDNENAARLQRLHAIHGDFGYPMVFHGVRPDDEEALGKTAEGDWVIQEQDDSTILVSDPYWQAPFWAGMKTITGELVNDQPVGINIAAFVDVFDRVLITDLVQFPAIVENPYQWERHTQAPTTILTEEQIRADEPIAKATLAAAEEAEWAEHHAHEMANA